MNIDLGRTDVREASGREHLLTVVFGLWMTVGLFLDGYFHQNLAGDSESFLTPWHGAFYSGFAATAIWLVTLSTRRSPTTSGWSLAYLPPGYQGARLGIVLFALGGAGDAAWHTAFGVERGIDALLSPTHLLLFAGLVLLLTAPLRAAWAATSSPPGRWMVVASVTSAAALAGFFVNFAWGLGIGALARVPYDAVTEAGEVEVIAGVGSTVVTTMVLFGAARLLRGAVVVPIGGFSVLFGVVALLVSVAFDEDAEGVVAAVAAGAALDWLLVRRRRRGHEEGLRFGAASTVLWGVYFSLLRASGGIEWQPEIWIGAVILNGFVACAIGGSGRLRVAAEIREG